MNKHQYTPAGQGKDFDYSQDHLFVKLSSHDTNGELAFVEDRLKPGFHLLRHHHKKTMEVFYILEGEVEMIFDDETIMATAGDTVTVPVNVWHEVFCKDGAKLLTIFKNGQFDLYIEALSTMRQEDFNDQELMKNLAEQYDIYNE